MRRRLDRLQALRELREARREAAERREAVKRLAEGESESTRSREESRRGERPCAADTRSATPAEQVDAAEHPPPQPPPLPLLSPPPPPPAPCVAPLLLLLLPPLLGLAALTPLLLLLLPPLLAALSSSCASSFGVLRERLLKAVPLCDAAPDPTVCEQPTSGGEYGTVRRMQPNICVSRLKVPVGRQGAQIPHLSARADAGLRAPLARVRARHRARPLYQLADDRPCEGGGS